MKIQDLRKLLFCADRDLLEKAFVESYKQFSKVKKEEIDLLICDILEGKEKKVLDNSKKEVIDFEELEQQIEEFIKNAYAQNYFVPNRVIPKNQRPKWRFLVKNYIKELKKISAASEFHHRAVKCLANLYNLICEACKYALFSADDPFRSIGWEQSVFFSLVVQKTLEASYEKEDIITLLLASITSGLSREALEKENEVVLAKGLNTEQARKIAMEEAKKIIEEKKKKYHSIPDYDNRSYELREDINHLCEIVLLIEMEMEKIKEGIQYYFTNYEKYKNELDDIVLYKALDLAEMMEAEKEWIEIYEYAIKKRIRPRNELAFEYQKRKK